VITYYSRFEEENNTFNEESMTGLQDDLLSMMSQSFALGLGGLQSYPCAPQLLMVAAYVSRPGRVRRCHHLRIAVFVLCMRTENEVVAAVLNALDDSQPVVTTAAICVVQLPLIVVVELFSSHSQKGSQIDFIEVGP
jgi:hypothetical protein